MDELRVIALLDMDTFYTQVEERERPELRGKPVAVVQITTNGSMGQAIAVNYAARAYGVRRGMNAVEMRDMCPPIQLCRVPPMEDIAKGDLSRYRNASDEVFIVLEEFSENILVEKASVDEAYLDLTQECLAELSKSTAEELIEKLISETEQLLPSTFLVDEHDKEGGPGSEERRLDSLRSWIRHNGHQRQQLAIAVGATLMERIRARLKEVTQFTCSAGIAHNKMLAKLVCSRHKPARQTVIVPQNLAVLYAETPIGAVRNLGGKFGNQLKERFGAKTMADLQLIPHAEFFTHFPENAVWLIRLLDGVDDEPISARMRPKSIGVSKNFPGKAMLVTISAVKKWVHGLSVELSKRLFEDEAKFSRMARNLVVGFSTSTGEHNVRTMPLANCTPDAINQLIWNFMKPFNKKTDKTEWYPPVSHIHMSTSRFEPSSGAEGKITQFFKNPKEIEIPEQQKEEKEKAEDDDSIIFLEERKESEKLEERGPERVMEQKENVQNQQEGDEEDIIIIDEDADDDEGRANPRMEIPPTDPARPDDSVGRRKKSNGGRTTKKPKSSKETKMKRPLGTNGMQKISKFFPNLRKK